MPTPIPWSVRVDWLNETVEAEQLLDTLADLRPVLVVDEPKLGSDVRYTVTVHLTEPTLRNAIATALRRVEDATGHRARGIEALTEDEIRRQLAQPNIPALVGNADIANMLGVTRQRAGQLADLPDFPPPVMTIKAGPLRVRDQVEDWARTWNRKSGRPSKTTPEQHAATTVVDS